MVLHIGFADETHESPVDRLCLKVARLSCARWLEARKEIQNTYPVYAEYQTGQSRIPFWISPSRSAAASAAHAILLTTSRRESKYLPLVLIGRSVGNRKRNSGSTSFAPAQSHFLFHAVKIRELVLTVSCHNRELPGCTFQTCQMPDASQFALSLVNDGVHMKIRSECLICGESRVVSAMDDSLENWRETHTCSQEPRPTQRVEPQTHRQKTSSGGFE